MLIPAGPDVGIVDSVAAQAVMTRGATLESVAGPRPGLLTLGPMTVNALLADGAAGPDHEPARRQTLEIVDRPLAPGRTVDRAGVLADSGTRRSEPQELEDAKGGGLRYTARGRRTAGVRQ